MEVALVRVNQKVIHGKEKSQKCKKILPNCPIQLNSFTIFCFDLHSSWWYRSVCNCATALLTLSEARLKDLRYWHIKGSTIFFSMIYYLRCTFPIAIWFRPDTLENDTKIAFSQRSIFVKANLVFINLIHGITCQSAERRWNRSMHCQLRLVTHATCLRTEVRGEPNILRMLFSIKNQKFIML